MHVILLAVILSHLSVTDIAGLIAPVGGLVIGILAARRGSKADKINSDVKEQEVVLEYYGQIVKDLQSEIERIRKQYHDDLLNWQNEKSILLRELEINQNIRKPRRRTPKDDN